MSSKLLKRQLRHLSSHKSATNDPLKIKKNPGRAKNSKRPRKETSKAADPKASHTYEERLEYYKAALQRTQASRKAALAMQKVAKPNIASLKSSPIFSECKSNTIFGRYIVD